MKPEEALKELSYDDTAYGGNCTYEVRMGAIKTLKKQIPRKVNNSSEIYLDFGIGKKTKVGACGNCPNCNYSIDIVSKYCARCGQRLDWEGSEKTMTDKPTPDITLILAISAYHVLRQYCTGQPADCKGCGFYEHCPECFRGMPCDWSLNEEGEINES